MRPLPPELAGTVFTTAEAREHGITPAMLRGRRLVTVTEGVHRYVDTEMSLTLAVAAMRKVLPPDAVLSHTTNLAWRGLRLGPPWPLHLAVQRDLRRRRPGLELHRYQGRLEVEDVRGVPVLRPARTFVDCATLLGERDLVALGDWMVTQGLVDLLDLRAYVIASHLDGVVRARRAARLVREGAESVRESFLRWELVGAGLPEPELNVDIHDGRGRFLARGDLVYPQRKVVVEYDGWYHERGAEQRQRDLARRERLESAGWRVIVVTAADLRDPKGIARRVASALS